MSPVGVREAKNRFSELAAEVNASGLPLTVMRNSKPWVMIYPADAEAAARRARVERLRALTQSIEEGAQDEPAWDPVVSDRDLLNEERVRRFG